MRIGRVLAVAGLVGVVTGSVGGIAGAQGIVYDRGQSIYSDAHPMSRRQNAMDFRLSGAATVTGANISTGQYGLYSNGTPFPNGGMLGFFDWAFYTDQSGTPGAMIASGTSVPTANFPTDAPNSKYHNVWTFGTSSVALNGNQTYWFSVLNTDATHAFLPTDMVWEISYGAECAALPSMSRSSTEAAWSQNGAFEYGEGREFCDGNQLSFQLTGTSTVPEPQSLALLATGLVGIIPFARRSRRR